MTSTAPHLVNSYVLVTSMVSGPVDFSHRFGGPPSGVGPGDPPEIGQAPRTWGNFRLSYPMLCNSAPNRTSSFWAGLRLDSSRESLKSARPARRPILRFSRSIDLLEKRPFRKWGLRNGWSPIFLWRCRTLAILWATMKQSQAIKHVNSSPDRKVQAKLAALACITLS